MNCELKKVLDLVKGSVTCVVDGERITFSSGQEAVEQMKENYAILSIYAEDNTVVLMLEADTTIPNDMNVDWVKEHVEKYGKEPSPFDGM